jgi:hypothetical protein
MLAGPVATHQEIETVFARYVSRRIPRGSPEHREQLALQSAKLDKRERAESRRPHSPWLDMTGARTVDRVVAGYERAWSTVSLGEQLGSAKQAWFEWQDDVMTARAIGRKHVHQLLLVRALEQIRPDSVAEVGFGNGFNLLLLAMQFPGVALAGVELTRAGVDAARRSSRDPRTTALLEPLAVSTVHRPAALDQDRLLQGRGDALPLRAKSVDVAFTTLALEQMDGVRDQALRELARIARRYVVMIEPFRDWNPDGIRRRYIEGQGYFDARVADLHAAGLNPVLATADFPNKISFHVGLVIAAVADDQRR